MDTKHIKINDYNYLLPDDRIAKFPVRQRDRSKLLVYRKGDITEDVFYKISDYIPSGALMVFNNTKVIQARMHFRKETGALIEIFLLEPVVPADYELMFQTTGRCSWLCMIGNLKKWKTGNLSIELDINGKPVMLTATRGNEIGTSHWVDFEWDNSEISFSEIIDSAGELPIPPYLNRDTQESDKTTYQTVYSKIKGSVAAPTAGLHFTDDVLRSLDDCGVQRDEITLHVGAGTFKPVKSDEIEGHDMHTEYISVHRSTLENLLCHGTAAIAVGTTSVRTLESLYYIGVHLGSGNEITENSFHVKQWEPYNGECDVTPEDAIRNIIAWLDANGVNVLHGSTQIIIAPGYEYKIVKMLVTNFHQPQSTLLLLVSAFVNGDWRRIYDYALSHDFRFLSYGDSSLLIP
ncbi:S-adenosylmethionine:tRNA ribosyltransferase-isomerase [Prevotella sp. PCHR]|uniref:S-adenosylmethionine:tRNA ribosyltransferase-isomerase n=1 Tax=Xylanibacter caecicola TaxID=2736294 RepID=A0ABX2AZY1_9BACT|nr:S-adenosylmethionine:tRNA ribosyltransferase-isomerase [Xylanibacter caecicola]NPE24747.1 S-adenosylmethionine:tRNA ribosyltransferase-isomerase [Xylanibacter caecicola]